MLTLLAILAVLLAVIVFLDRQQRHAGPIERRHPGKALPDQEPLAERRKDDDVGGEAG